MRLPGLNPYRRVQRFIEAETFEPALNWGLRMAVATVIPVIWGLATGHLGPAQWVALTAEAICWVELRGTYATRLRVLVAGAALACLSSLLGTISAVHIVPSVAAMFVVGFCSNMFKNLGDRGSGLAICLFVMFILSNAYPVEDLVGLRDRFLLTAAGGVWAILLSLLAIAFIKEQEPYRRSIALIWKSISRLTETVMRGWDGRTARSNSRSIYLREQEVRAAMDQSLHFYEHMVHQASTKDPHEYQLAQVRKASSLVGAHILAINDILQEISLSEPEEAVRLRLHAMLRALKQVMDRMASYTLTLRPEEGLLLQSRMKRLCNLASLMREHRASDERIAQAMDRLSQLTERSHKLLERCMQHLNERGSERPIYRSYSLIKTLYVLHPSHLGRNLRSLLNLNTLMVRYALRAAVATSVALFIYKRYDIQHGYWIPLTVLITLQPFFGATITRGIERSIGTILGGIAGGILLRTTTGLLFKEVLLFISAVLMVYYIRKRYSVAAFFITVTMVLLFAVEAELTMELLISRTLCTIGGAAISIVAGFALLPTWDRKYLPRHLSQAIACNYQYFKITFYPPDRDISWTRYKRNSEVRNSNAFDSFNRFMNEPLSDKKKADIFYELITHNVRVTRELNNIHMDRETGTETGVIPAEEAARQSALIYECHIYFNKLLHAAHRLEPMKDLRLMPPPLGRPAAFSLSAQQELAVDKLILELKCMLEDMPKLAKGSRQ